MEAQGEKLLQDLVSQEQALVAKVEDAKAEAAEIIKEAQAKAAAIAAEARTRAETLARQQAEKTRAESEVARQAILNDANAGVAAIESRAEKSIDSAVEFVLEQVLP
ncbi:MAG TPA: V-type ATPase subunit subunit G family protein [Trueperaceae bacterium]